MDTKEIRIIRILDGSLYFPSKSNKIGGAMSKIILLLTPTFAMRWIIGRNKKPTMEWFERITKKEDFLFVSFPSTVFKDSKIKILWTIKIPEKLYNRIIAYDKKN
ncbi:MAG: hypothetical protein J6I84_03765 [Bacilli bacterium]|nr:hypothetical protein [Bacilli bacterium]